MKVIDPGHRYELEGGQLIQFIKKVPKPFEVVTNAPQELVTVAHGTTNEEVLDVLIDRTETLNSILPCRENAEALKHLRAAKEWFLIRRQKRADQGVLGTGESHE